jgi:hypothetical protein
VEAVSSASGHWRQPRRPRNRGACAGQLQFLQLIQFHFVRARIWRSLTLGDYALEANIPVLNWLLDKTVLANDGMQIFMQVMIVLMELAVGLALMGGLLTAPASALRGAAVHVHHHDGHLPQHRMMIFASVACPVRRGSHHWRTITPYRGASGAGRAALDQEWYFND